MPAPVYHRGMPRTRKPRLGRPPRAGKGAQALLTVKLTAAEYRAYKAAAAEAGYDLSTFTRLALDALVKRAAELSPPL